MAINTHPAKKVKLVYIVSSLILRSLVPKHRINEVRRRWTNVYLCLFRNKLEFTDLALQNTKNTLITIWAEWAQLAYTKFFE